MPAPAGEDGYDPGKTEFMFMFRGKGKHEARTQIEQLPGHRVPVANNAIDLTQCMSIERGRKLFA